MTKLAKIDLQAILLQFIELYGQNAIFYFFLFVSFIFSIWLTYLYIRHRGWISTPLEKTMKKQEQNIEKNTELLSGMIEMVKIAISNQQSVLQEDQVKIIVNDKIILYKYYFIKDIAEIYKKNHIIETERTINKIKDSFKAIIRDEDELFFTLPGVARQVIPTALKLKTLEVEKIYDKIYLIMREETEVDEVVRRVKNLLDNFISNNWKIIYGK